MPYRLSLDSGKIHDASKPHAAKMAKEKVLEFETIEEARAKAVKLGLKPLACGLCHFSPAVKDQIDL